MAKKRAAVVGDVNVSAEIRDVLEKHPGLSGREVMEAVQAKHPGVTFNEKSFQVAYSNSRRRLGLGKKRRVVKRAKPVAADSGPRQMRRSVGNRVSVDTSQLQAAAEYVAKVGNAAQAKAALDQLLALQLG